MAASSFDGVNVRFEIDATTAAGPTWERASYTTTRHIPGSNSDAIQAMGYGHGTLTARVLVDPTEWIALQGKQLVDGELIIAGISQGTCLLEALASPEREVDGWVTVQATFRQTAAS